MARIKLQLPPNIHFSAELPIRISDINYGKHLGNDSLLSLIHEARVQFLQSYGYTEMNVEGSALIMNDVAIVYKAEAFYGETLRFDVSAVDFHRFGCDLFYGITNTETAKEIARAKTGIIFYNYEEKKLVDVPEKFQSRFP